MTTKNVSLEEAKLEIGDILLQDMAGRRKVLIDRESGDVSLFKSTLIAGVEEGNKFVIVHAYYRVAASVDHLDHRDWVPDYYEVHDGFDEGLL